MKIGELAEKAGFKLLAGEAAIQNEVAGCYAGDLLSWVMSRAKSGDIWLTVMGNVNAVAVASLTDTAGILLTENAPLDNDAKLKADEQEIPVFTCEQNSFEAAILIQRFLKL